VLKKTVIAALAGLSPAACTSTSSNLSLESRDIAVEQNAEPMGGVAGGNMAALARAAGPSYVTLTVSAVFDDSQTKKDGAAKSPITSGSGFVVDENGYVMTAAHVAVKAGNTISARAADGRVYSGKVVAILPTNDMALIKLRGFRGKSVVPVSSPCLARGAEVFSLGKPHEMGDTARFGAVESMSFGQPVRYGNFGYPDAMVMRMGTQKGESGGPLFDGTGHLAGMVVSTLSDGSGRSLNLAHAIPASQLANFFCSNAACASGWSAIASASPPRCT
jgi:serine protease Do